MFKSKTFVLFFVLFLVALSHSDDTCCKYNQIQVSGQGKASGRPDLANINVRFSETGKTAAQAVNKIAEKINQLLAILKTNGYGNDAFQSNYFYVYDQYGNVNGVNQVIGKQATQSILIKIRATTDIGVKVAALIDAFSPIDGINIDSVSFDINDKSSIQSQARAAAFKDARTKAEDYASFTGLTVGKIIAIEDLSYVSPYLSSSTGLRGPGSSTYPGTSVPIGELETTYTTTVTFSLR